MEKAPINSGYLTFACKGRFERLRDAVERGAGAVEPGHRVALKIGFVFAADMTAYCLLAAEKLAHSSVGNLTARDCITLAHSSLLEWWNQPSFFADTEPAAAADLQFFRVCKALEGLSCEAARAQLEGFLGTMVQVLQRYAFIWSDPGSPEKLAQSRQELRKILQPDLPLRGNGSRLDIVLGVLNAAPDMLLRPDLEQALSLPIEEVSSGPTTPPSLASEGTREPRKSQGRPPQFDDEADSKLVADWRSSKLHKRQYEEQRGLASGSVEAAQGRRRARRGRNKPQRT